jgi:hypothetical protein
MEGDSARRLALLGLCLGLLLLAPSHLASAAAVEDGMLCCLFDRFCFLPLLEDQ